VAHGRIGTQPRAWKYAGADQWQSDKVAEPAWTTTQLLATAELGTELTMTGVPPGSGARMALDEDRDGYLDGDERDVHSDPGNPLVTPQNAGVPSGLARPGLQAVSPNPFRVLADVQFTLAHAGAVDVRIYDVLGREVR